MLDLFRVKMRLGVFKAVNSNSTRYIYAKKTNECIKY